MFSSLQFVDPVINFVLFVYFQEVLHTISSPHGQVQRIVIFKKNGVQAMVEYPFCEMTNIDLVVLVKWQTIF